LAWSPLAGICGELSSLAVGVGDVQQVLFENTARAMGDARVHIKQRHVENCTRAYPTYGAGVAKAVGINSTPLTIAAE
jgi:catalase